MMNAKRISRCGRNYHVSLPKRWCARVGVSAGDAVLIRGEIDGTPDTCRARVLACARGLHVTVPRVWRRWWRLRYGSWVVVLLGEGPELTLQSVPGISPKEWEARGWVELLERLEAMERRLEDVRKAGYAEGLATGHNLGLGAGLRMADDLQRQDPSLE